MQKHATSLAYLFIALAVVITTYFNYISLVEAYGSGPPYYSRTTNMDKWSNPLPILIGVDILVLTFSYMGLRYLSKSNKSSNK